MSSKLTNHAKNIGDIDVYYDKSYVQITVDGDTVIFIPRSATNGLASLADVLAKLVDWEGP